MDTKECLQVMIEKKMAVDIKISQSDIDYLQDFIQKMIAEKQKEAGRKRDFGSMAKRELTGKLGELAIERWLTVPFLDLSIGNSKDYAIPDLRAAGYEMGCKTVTIDNAAVLVPKRPTVPELICVWDEPNMTVHIMGIASVSVIKEFGDAALIKSPKVNRNIKTGFGRYDKLLPPTQFWMNKWKSSEG